MEEFFQLNEKAREVLSGYGLEEEKLQGCSLRKYGFGEEIIGENRPSEGIYLVIRGKAKVGATALTGNRMTLCYYLSQGLMGEMEFFSGSAWGGASVTAVSELWCLAIPTGVNGAYLKENRIFLEKAASELARKLLESSRSVTDNTLCSAEVRLCRHILAAEEGGYFRDVMTEVSGALGVSYRHLYRMLGKLCRQGILEKTEMGYRILDRQGLYRCSQPIEI